MSSQEDLDVKKPFESADEPRSIEIDKETGEQVVIANDGENLFTIDPKAERALVWK